MYFKASQVWLAGQYFRYMYLPEFKRAALEPAEPRLSNFKELYFTLNYAPPRFSPLLGSYPKFNQFLLML